MTVETETFETEFFNTRALNYGCRVMRSGDPCRMIEAKGMGTMELTARGSSFDPIDSRQPVELALPPPTAALPAISIDAGLRRIGSLTPWTAPVAPDGSASPAF